MNTEKPIFTPFRQTPIWDETATFELTGKQLMAVQDMFKAYTPFVQALESVFIQGLNDGKITIKYEDLDGNPMVKEDIDAMLQRYAENMAEGIDEREKED